MSRPKYQATNLTPYAEECIYLRTTEDDAAFAAIAETLPVRAPDTPFHCGPHSLRALRMAYNFCGKPENVLEVGFCIGHSASMWFSFGAKNVTSLDVSDRAQTMEAAKMMKERHGEHFRFLQGSSERLLAWQPEMEFGMMFIDGGHEFPQISADIALGKALKIPFLVFDDFYEKWGPGTQRAIQQHDLVTLAIIGNQALCQTREKFHVDATYHL